LTAAAIARSRAGRLGPIGSTPTSPAPTRASRHAVSPPAHAREAPAPPVTRRWRKSANSGSTAGVRRLCDYIWGRWPRTPRS
jgi:hypothetical protein